MNSCFSKIAIYENSSWFIITLSEIFPIIHYHYTSNLLNIKNQMTSKKCATLSNISITKYYKKNEGSHLKIMTCQKNNDQILTTNDWSLKNDHEVALVTHPVRLWSFV